MADTDAALWEREAEREQSQPNPVIRAPYGGALDLNREFREIAAELDEIAALMHA